MGKLNESCLTEVKIYDILCCLPSIPFSEPSRRHSQCLWSERFDLSLPFPALGCIEFGLRARLLDYIYRCTLPLSISFGAIARLVRTEYAAQTL